MGAPVPPCWKCYKSFIINIQTRSKTGINPIKSKLCHRGEDVGGTKVWELESKECKGKGHSLKVQRILWNSQHFSVSGNENYHDASEVKSSPCRRWNRKVLKPLRVFPRTLPPLFPFLHFSRSQGIQRWDFSSVHTNTSQPGA